MSIHQKKYRKKLIGQKRSGILACRPEERVVLGPNLFFSNDSAWLGEDDKTHAEQQTVIFFVSWCSCGTYDGVFAE